MTLVFRGDALTPDGLAQIARTVGGIEADPLVAPLLAAETVHPLRCGWARPWEQMISPPSPRSKSTKPPPRRLP